jgi:peptidoglycan/xylan/chitin deacetylase (PgdA/CDA1 family)
MLFHGDLRGDRLPPGTLCLTYDDGPGDTPGDGPGPRTLAIGRYLHKQGIRATFFVIGCHAEGQGHAMRQLHDWGHLIGNHTYNHPGLVALARTGGDVAAEVARCENLIQTYAPAKVVFLRPPYGSWRRQDCPDDPEDRSFSPVAAALNRDNRLRHLVGPIKWDVAYGEWDWWRRGASAEECAPGFLRKIEEKGRGIVLLHDSSDEEDVRRRNRTWELTRLVVPALKTRGFRFVALDEVPQVRSALPVRALIVLRTEDGQYLSRTWGGEEIVFDPVERETFGVVALGTNRLALRANTGQFVSFPERAERVLASAWEAGMGEALESERVGKGKFLLHTAAGRYLARDCRTSGRIRACTESRQEATIFTIQNVTEGGIPIREVTDVARELLTQPLTPVGMNRGGPG